MLTFDFDFQSPFICICWFYDIPLIGWISVGVPHSCRFFLYICINSVLNFSSEDLFVHLQKIVLYRSFGELFGTYLKDLKLQNWPIICSEQAAPVTFPSLQDMWEKINTSWSIGNLTSNIPTPSSGTFGLFHFIADKKPNAFVRYGKSRVMQ